MNCDYTFLQADNTFKDCLQTRYFMQGEKKDNLPSKRLYMLLSLLFLQR